MASEISSTASGLYVSAPTSPGDVFNQDGYSIGVFSFYSVPASPTRCAPNIINDSCHDDVTNPTATAPSASDVNEDSNFNLDDFEFETSRRFHVDEYDLSEDELENGKELHEQQECYAKQRRESLPAMAFADELFCQGKVMPLKPPPRLHFVNDESFVSHRSSPSSPSSMLRIPFTRRSLWNDDFDPFMVALENVREDKRGNHRRSKTTFTTFPACMSEQSLSDDLFSSNDGNNECLKKYYSMPNPENQNGNTEHKRPVKLAEPKGVVFARRARMVKMANELPNKSAGSAFPELMVETGEGKFGKEIISVSWSGQNIKRKKIKNLFKSWSMKKKGDEGEQYLEPKKPKMARKLSLMKSKGSFGKVEERRKDENEGIDEDLKLKKSEVKRKLSSKSTGLVECKEEEKVCEESKMKVVKHRPKMLLCMGVGPKYVK